MSEWTCPRCRQKFVQKNARHSCDLQTIASFFAGYPRPRALFRAVRSPKIKEAVEVRPGRWTHHLVLRDEGQLDAEVRGWLCEAYAMAAGGATARKRRGAPS